jgi:hypothetical protein
MEGTSIDVTQEFFVLSQRNCSFDEELGFMDTVLHPDLDLEETMHAHEINDPKIDPKWDIH